MMRHALCVAFLAAAGPVPSRPIANTVLDRILTETDISVEYDQIPAREVFRHMQAVLGIRIVGRYSDDRAGHGIDPETPISLALNDTPAVVVLETALEQCADLEPCTWQIRNGFVEVGTKERLSTPAALEVRLYPIRDLLMIAPDFDNAPTLDLAAALGQTAGGGSSGGAGGGFGGGGGAGSIISDPAGGPARVEDAEFVEQLMDLIRRTVEPESWEVYGGTATMSYLSGSLIVRAPGFLHRRLGG